MLGHAFGPVGAPAVPDADSAAAFSLADGLVLAGRIAWRSPGAVEKLPERTAERFRDRRRRIAASSLVLETVVEEAAALAASAGIPLVLLKGAALRAARCSDPSARGACDVDVLVPADRAWELQRLFLARGYSSTPLEAEPHHLPALTSPRGGGVEVHHRLWGVRARGSDGWADHTELSDAGLLVEAPPFGPTVSLPRRDLLVAHALAHGLVQHFDSPHAYPLANVLADLADLGFHGGGGRALVPDVCRLVAPELDRETVNAMLELVTDLCAGTLDLRSRGERDFGALFVRHLVAGTYDERYRRSLKPRALWTGLGAGAEGIAARAADLARVVFPSRARLEALYPGEVDRLGSPVVRALRPLRLAGRLAASVGAAAWLRFSSLAGPAGGK